VGEEHPISISKSASYATTLREEIKVYANKKLTVKLNPYFTRINKLFYPLFMLSSLLSCKALSEFYPVSAIDESPQSTQATNGKRIVDMYATDSAVGIIAGKPESRNHDNVSEDQDAAFKIVALAFAVHVTQQEDAENDGNHVPLREDER
jgi:hypothetical protein